MQDVDDLVEDSLTMLDDEEIESELFRSVAARLYDFQSHYETTPTYFRLMETLLEHDYFLELPLEAHPDYEAHADDFDDHEAGRVVPIFRDPGADWDADDNPVAGYLCNDQLYVEVGSPLCQRIVGSGEIAEATLPAIEDIPFYRAVSTVCRMADRQGNDELLLRWYTTLGFHLAMNVERDSQALLDELRGDSDVQRLREIAGTIDDFEMRVAHPEVEAEAPPPELRQAHPVLQWWYEAV